MATFTVDTLSDDPSDGDTLREAVAKANATTAADTIVFDSGLGGQTLTLTGGELVLRQDVTIDGGAIGVTISGGDTQQILRTSGGGTDVELDHLTLTHGQVTGSASGGALFVGGGSVALNESVVEASRSENVGGGIYASADTRVSLVGSTLRANHADGAGGAVFLASDSQLDVTGTALASNGTFYNGGALWASGGDVRVADSSFSHNGAEQAGAIGIVAGSLLLERSTIDHSSAYYAGGVLLDGSVGTIVDSTVASNRAANSYDTAGGITAKGGSLSIRNSTITANVADHHDALAGGVVATGKLEIENSIVAGNFIADHPSTDLVAADVSGTISVSNGHNVFGSAVTGSIPGDVENMPAAALFAALDPLTGGGYVGPSGIVQLLNDVANPAVSAADLLAASATGQTGASRPLPAGSLPDIGSVEIGQPLSTSPSANNDVITDGSAGHTIKALAGADYVKGMGGADTLHGGDGGDLLDGGPGNDKLYGDAGIDLVYYGGSAKVTFDLAAATARRGSETDTLAGLEGAIGSTAADSFKGNQFNNYFQGGLGKDSFTGGGGRDLYDLNAVAESGVGSNKRDVISDFDHLVDDIDLMGIDANTGVAGNQAFHWVGTAALTGAGQVGFFNTGGNTTIIRGSVDADAASEFEIQLTGSKTLTEVDFYL